MRRLLLVAALVPLLGCASSAAFRDGQKAERVQDWVQLKPDLGGVFLAFQPWSASQASGVPGEDRLPWVRPDIEVADIDAAAARIVALGGQKRRVVLEPNGDTHIVMADPEGNEFAILPPLPPELARPGTPSA